MSNQNFSQNFPDYQQDSAEPLIAPDAMNDTLRQQLERIAGQSKAKTDNTLPTKTESTTVTKSLKTQTLSHILQSGVDIILSHSNIDKPLLQSKLDTMYEGLNSVYEQADIPSSLRTRQFISKHGLIMSTNHCVTTQRDLFRVRSFIRGVHHAIKKKLSQTDNKIHLVYPACGPFAPLLLPLLAHYQHNGEVSPEQLNVTLIDIQPAAVASLQAVIRATHLQSFIHKIVCIDACDYQPDIPIDIIVLEAMQHGVSREAFIPIARHFANVMKPDAFFLPEKVSVRAVIGVGQREFVEQWQNQRPVEGGNMLTPPNIHRIEMGEVLAITPQFLQLNQDLILDEHTRLLPCAELCIPTLIDEQDKPLLLLCTTINVYGEDTLNEYDSGITHPLPDMQVCINFKPKDAKPGDLLVNSGDRLKFYYRLNGLPGFMTTLAASPSAKNSKLGVENERI
ncbi:hypothetical protein [Algibacillus agarilyticus]|uniref:hypothetical protein n=1 Tax=Algibacillus agarilyticus TaxID=2234133 RepID=UPI000DD00CBD|nr:hypothetical protein [Algibacillus agarilyticus]